MGEAPINRTTIGPAWHQANSFDQQERRGKDGLHIARRCRLAQAIWL